METQTIYTIFSAIRANFDRFDRHAAQISGGSFDIGSQIGILECKREAELQTNFIRRVSEVSEYMLDVVA